MALKPAAFYAQQMITKSQVPPTSTQVKYYTDLAELMLLMLADADVLALGLVAPSGGGPVTGSAKIA